MDDGSLDAPVDEPLPTDYPVIGQLVCPQAGCEVVVDIHARLKIRVYRKDEDSPPLLEFDADVYPDEFAMHLAEHGVPPKYFDSVEGYITNREEEQ